MWILFTSKMIMRETFDSFCEMSKMNLRWIASLSMLYVVNFTSSINQQTVQLISFGKLSCCSLTLIDSTFTNVILLDLLSGNLTANISNHFPQFLIVRNIFPHSPCSKSHIYERLAKLWSIKLHSEWNNENWRTRIDYSNEIFLNKINELLDNFALV